MREVPLQVEYRTERGSRPARRLRAAGKVPATMYGRGTEPVNLVVDARELRNALTTDAGVNALLTLNVDGEDHLAMARELSRDPVRGSIIHVDFLQIDRTKSIAIDVPVHLEGEPQGVKEGGVLEHNIWQLHVECLPGNVPESIDLDVSAMVIGDVLRVADITPPEGVTILADAEEPVASVVVPQVLEVEAPEEEVEGEALEGEEGEAAEGEAAEGGDESESSDES